MDHYQWKSSAGPRDWNFSHFVHLTRVQISKLNNRNIILHFFRTYSNRIYFFALHDKNKKNYHFTLLSPLAEIQYTEAGRFHEKSRGSRTWDQNFLLLTSETTYGTVSISMSFPIFLNTVSKWVRVEVYCAKFRSNWWSFLVIVAFGRIEPGKLHDF